MNSKKLIIIFGVIIAVVYLQHCYSEIRKEIARSNHPEDKNLSHNRKLPIEYKAIFDSAVLKKISVNATLYFEIRNPMSCLNYDNNYCIFINRINLSDKNVSLKNIFHQEAKDFDDIPSHTTYTFMDAPGYSFNFNAGIIKPATGFYLTFSGDSINNNIMNDSVVAYHLLCSSFSVRYQEKDVPDILIMKPEQKMFAPSRSVPLDILFIKKNKGLYFLLLSPNNVEEHISADMLYNMISKYSAVADSSGAF